MQSKDQPSMLVQFNLPESLQHSLQEDGERILHKRRHSGVHRPGVHLPGVHGRAGGAHGESAGYKPGPCIWGGGRGGAVARDGGQGCQVFEGHGEERRTLGSTSTMYLRRACGVHTANCLGVGTVAERTMRRLTDWKCW